MMVIFEDLNIGDEFRYHPYELNFHTKISCTESEGIVDFVKVIKKPISKCEIVKSVDASLLV